MHIRYEQEADIAAISAVHIEAFRGHPYSRQTEHMIVDALRAAGALAVSLVAEVDGRVAGHICFSQALIGGQDCGWYALGPIGVRPARQRKGAGTALMLSGLGAIRALGARGCVLAGDPEFYGRFGFCQAASLSYPGVPAMNLLCRTFSGDTPSGEVAFHPAFSVG